MLPLRSLSKNTLVVVRNGTSATLPALNVAAGLSSRLQHILAVLAPVIGECGVVALYQRSLDVSGRVFPWLAAPEECYRGGMDLDALRSLVAQQIDTEAATGAAFLLKTFHDQLAVQVGSAVTRQLIGASPCADPVDNNREQVVPEIKRLWRV